MEIANGARVLSGLFSKHVLHFCQQTIAGDSWGFLSVPIIEESPGLGLIFFGVKVTGPVLDRSFGVHVYQNKNINEYFVNILFCKKTIISKRHYLVKFKNS